MKNALNQISSSIEEALAVTDTFDHSKGSTASLKLSCFDGRAATNAETLGNPGEDTDNTGSLLSCTTPQKPLVDQRGNIRNNTWF